MNVFRPAGPAPVLFLLLMLCRLDVTPALRRDGGIVLRSAERIVSLKGERVDEVVPSRAKRSATEEAEGKGEEKEERPISPMTSAFHLNSSHLSLMTNWVGKDSSVVFCLARDLEMGEEATSNLFMSEDYGTSFKDISDRFKLLNGQNAVIARYYHHSRSNCRYVFADTVNKYLFTSADCGKTVSAHSLQMVPDVVEFDVAQDGDVFLVHDLTGDQKSLFVTTDFGETFSHVQDYVKAFFFREPGNGVGDNYGGRSVLYVQRMEPGGERTTILSSTNYFQRQVDTTVVYSGAHEFELRGDYMFVTRPKRDRPGELDLFVSAHGERFVPADFGIDDRDLASLDYHIIDVTDEGQVLVCVNHDHVLSNLYASARITPYKVEFALSLERIMYYNPNVTWTDSWLSDTAGDEPFADVYKVQGLRGIYIASQIDSESMKHEDVQPQDLKSLITFDQGGVWSKIAGPETDDEGYPYPGCDHGGCSLHLSQQLSKRFPSTRSVPVMSSASAVGIVMANGNVGQTLSQRSNVFLSADSGLSWHQVLKGSYYFNIGDHGGVIVAAKYYKTEGRTDELLYSTDDGLTWNSLRFYHEPLRIFGLLTEPGENTTIFTMFGTASPLLAGSPIDWIIVKVDLRDAFDHDCTLDDYKRWSPADGTHGKHRNCILGRKEVYERRVVRSNCYSGRGYERRVTAENCGCDRSDYLCDFGFRPEGTWHDGCIKDPKFEHDAYAPPEVCPVGTYYNRTRGYIRIRGDTCSGGLAKRYEPEPMLCPVEEEKEFLLVSQREAIVRINLRDLEDVQTLPLKNVKNVITLEFDMQDNCVMYGDIEVDKIFIQCLNGSEPRVLVESALASVEGMAYDWITKTLYFVDGTRKSIELVRVDMRNEGRMRKTILSGKTLSKPRGLAVHPIHGYLYFSDWNEQRPQVARANMDGSNVKTLWTAPHVQWPNGLSIDYIANRVYWVDAREDYIASCDLDGGNFKKILSRIPELVHPFAVAVHKELMYWDDWNKKAIFVADKNTGKGIRAVRTNMNGSMDLKIYSSIHHSGINACTNRPCSHLCVAMPDNHFQCLCPDGMKSGDDGSGRLVCKCPDGTTIPQANGTCPQKDGRCQEGQFTCQKNHLCIPEKWKCDGDDDCGDGSDESSCVRDECHDFQFQCDNRHCIPAYWKCDFDDDCGDGSDEKNCTVSECTRDQFRCDNGQCISKKWMCDMEKDCQDGSDERNCTTQAPQCKPEEFHCPGGGQCLPTSWKCDGDRDCPDGSDEEDCEGMACKDYQFTCGDGICIFDTWRCDGHEDCRDGSDEANCTKDGENGDAGSGPGQSGAEPSNRPVFPKGECNRWMFKCANEECIPYWWKCDGTPDCSDASDEMECHHIEGHEGGYDDDDSYEDDDDDGGGEPQTPSPTAVGGCGENRFRCNDGECIWQAWVCDGEKDCDGGEEEDATLCAGWANCTNNDFRCELSGECVDASRLCNGVDDCVDKSDESGCDLDEAEDDEYRVDEDGRVQCGNNEISCDNGGYCVHESKVCDGVTDCYDGTDEQSCHLPHIVAGLQADPDSITATSVRLDWWMESNSDPSATKLLACYVVVGTSKEICGEEVDGSTYSYNFEALHPYTAYNFTVRVVGDEGTPYPAKQSVVARTATAAPSPPRISEIRAEDDGKVFVAWTPPASPNGRMRSYVLHLSPAGREWQVSADRHNATLDFDFVPGTNYSVGIIAINEEFHGESSIEASLVYAGGLVTERVEGLRQIGAGPNSVYVTWDKPKENPGNTEAYEVNVKPYDNALVTFTSLMVHSDRIDNVTLEGMSPNETYTVLVSVSREGISGPPTIVQVETTGASLPIPKIQKARLTDTRTSVELNWTVPPDTRRTTWEYGVFYGASMDEIYGRGNERRAPVGNTSLTVDGLDSCESYIFAVAVMGPRGVGRLSDPVTEVTKYSPVAPPKDLRLEVDERNMKIKWNASCPQIDEPVGYYVTIENLSTQQRDVKFVSKSTDSRQELSIDDLRHGARYEVTVRTDVAGSAPTGPERASGPPLPVPRGITRHLARAGPDGKVEQLIYWSLPEEDLPDYLAESGDFSYRVFLSERPDLSSPALVFNATEPPFDLSRATAEGAVSPGRLYYVGVALVDADQYVSAASDAVAVETALPEGDLVVSRRSVAGVLVPVLLLVVALGSGLAYYVYRNRRLTRSFQAFASRYSAASGAAILNQGALDDDDESPIIRGFADDEPLVVT